jgi:hypothetical protein
MALTNSNNINKELNIVKENTFFKDLNNLMNNVEFKKIYNKYFTNWDDIQAMIFFMKLHSTINYEYNRIYNKKIDDTEMELVLFQVMDNQNTRKMALSLFNEYKTTIDYKKTKEFRQLLTFSGTNSCIALLDN